MPHDATITLHIETSPDHRLQFVAFPDSSIWPFVWQALASTQPLDSPVYTLNLEVVDIVRYVGVIVDLMNQQPQMFLYHMGVVDGSVVRVGGVRASKWMLQFPTPTSPQGSEEEDESLFDVDGGLSPEIIEISDDTDEEEYTELDWPKDKHVPSLLLCDFKECQYKSKSWRFLRQHFKAVHRVGRLFGCPYTSCGAQFLEPRDYLAHFDEEHDGVRLPRNGRKKLEEVVVYESDEDVEQSLNDDDDDDKSAHTSESEHERDSVATHERPWTCDICNASYTQRRHLDMHNENHHSSKTKSLVCPVCTDSRYLYTWPESLVRHLRRSHHYADQKKIDRVMEYASAHPVYRKQKGSTKKSAKTPPPKVQPPKTHAPPEKRTESTTRGSRDPHKCDRCGEWIMRSDNLATHKKRFHSPMLTVYPCPMCGDEDVVFKWTQGLSVHLRKVHRVENEHRLKNIREEAKRNARQIPNPDCTP